MTRLEIELTVLDRLVVGLGEQTVAEVERVERVDVTQKVVEKAVGEIAVARERQVTQMSAEWLSLTALRWYAAHEQTVALQQLQRLQIRTFDQEVDEHAPAYGRLVELDQFETRQQWLARQLNWLNDL